MHERISIDPKVCHGWACIKGTRIPVHQIVHMLANGDAIEDLLREYPALSRKDILACLDYAASLAEEHITPIESLTKASYLEELVAALWEYRATYFAGRQECFDRQLSSTSRPPVFRKKWEDENVLLAPDISSDERDVVVTALPQRKRHRWFASMKSSQALAQSVFANLDVLKKLHLLLEVRNDDGDLVFAGPSPWTRMTFEHEACHLNEPRPTSVDVFFDGGYRIAVECKLSEEDVGWCSRPRLTPRDPNDPNYSKEYCDGRYVRQRDRVERCSLTALGIKYWSYIPGFLTWPSDTDHDQCPLRTTYQLVRNLLVGCVTDGGRADPDGGHAVLLYDERNPAFANGGRGWEAYQSVRHALKVPQLLRRCSWQRMLVYLQPDRGLFWLLNGLKEKYGLIPSSTH